MVCFVITTNILLLSALIAILSQSLTKVRCLGRDCNPHPLLRTETRLGGGVLLASFVDLLEDGRDRLEG